MHSFLLESAAILKGKMILWLHFEQMSLWKHAVLFGNSEIFFGPFLLLWDPYSSSVSRSKQFQSSVGDKRAITVRVTVYILGRSAYTFNHCIAEGIRAGAAQQEGFKKVLINRLINKGHPLTHKSISPHVPASSSMAPNILLLEETITSIVYFRDANLLLTKLCQHHQPSPLEPPGAMKTAWRRSPHAQLSPTKRGGVIEHLWFCTSLTLPLVYLYVHVLSWPEILEYVKLIPRSQWAFFMARPNTVAQQ